VKIFQGDKARWLPLRGQCWHWTNFPV